MTAIVSLVSNGSLGPDDVAAAAQLACLLEVSAPKPGNVSPGQHFSDTRYEHFLASAAAIGNSLADAGTATLGTVIRRAQEATARWTSANTNLGIVLLLAPLAAAARREAPADAGAGAGGVGTAVWREALRELLAATTVEDAEDVFAAIRSASPGGLGRADEQDVHAPPTLTLLEVMRLAEARDGIAREYATGFATTFEVGAPALARARRDGLAWDAAVVETFLTLLAASPDTHIARRAGAVRAADVSRLAADAVARGGVRSEAGRQAIAAMDAALRDPANSGNPGTTADLTAAAIFVVLLLERGTRNPGWGFAEATRSASERWKSRALSYTSDMGSLQHRGLFRVSVTKDYLVFASAHFITFAGHRCEGLHGHNYRASVVVEGRLNEEAWFVFDFVELKRIMKRLCDEIDHLVLLPLESDRVRVEEDGENVRVAVDGKPRYLFPRRDCALLPIPNTTVEMLAELLTERLKTAMTTAGATGLTAIEMEVEENFGQSAVYRLDLTR